MKKNKKIIILVVVIIILLIGVIKFVFLKEKTTEVPKTDKKTSFETIKPIDTTGKTSPKTVSYVTQTLVVPEKKMPVYKISNQKLNEGLIDTIAKSFGFKNKPEVSVENFIMYSNQEDNTGLDINKQTLTVKFSKNLLLNPMIKSMKTTSVEEISEKLKILIIKNFGLEKGIKIKAERIEYETLAGPRFVTSTRDTGNIVKITCNYEIDGFPVFSATRFPITARFSTDGNLLYLSVDLPFNNVAKQGDFSVKNEEEIKATPVEKYIIVDVEGGRDFDLSSTIDIVENVNITDNYPGYLYSPENNYLSPYIFLKGNSRLQSGPVTVILAVPALKEETYYK